MMTCSRPHFDAAAAAEVEVAELDIGLDTDAAFQMLSHHAAAAAAAAAVGQKSNHSKEASALRFQPLQHHCRLRHL